MRATEQREGRKASVERAVGVMKVEMVEEEKWVKDAVELVEE